MVELPPRGAFPEMLLVYDQWICWRSAERDGKPTKVPVDPSTGEFASPTDPSTWTTFGAARARGESDEVDGLGFVFTADDPIVGIDLDDCRDLETGQPNEWAKSVIETLDSFTEVSPSGTGYHVLLEGNLPEGRNRRGDIECYETARFFTVTGDHVAGTPSELLERTAELESVYREYLAREEESSGERTEATDRTPSRSLDDDDLIERARNAANGEKFARLWRGDTSGYDSHSEADMALCSLLAFWTGGDEQQIDRLFGDSGLMREKWDEVHYADGSTYGEMTIERAVAGTDEFYEPRPDTPVSDSDVDPSVGLDQLHSREVKRLERLESLEQRLNEVLEEKAELESELAAERARRRKLEAQLEDEQHSTSMLGGLFACIRD